MKALIPPASPCTPPRHTRQVWSPVLPDAFPPSRGRALVVAPHPDDETFGAGGTIHDLCAMGFELTVVVVTDGEASHAGVAHLSGTRRNEATDACAALGVLQPPQFLGFPDGQVAANRETLAAALRTLIQGCALVIGPRSDDGHPDHDATGQAVTEALMGIAEDRRPVLWRYAIWAWEWGTITADDLSGAYAWRVSADGRSARSDAIRLYPSQATDLLGEVIVPNSMVADIRSADEVFWC